MRKIFDINVHVSSFESSKNYLDTISASDKLKFEKKFDTKKIHLFYDKFSKLIRKKNFNSFYGYNLMIFAEKINFDNLNKTKDKNCLSKTVLCNFRAKNIKKYITSLKENKINAIKFHPYFQKIHTKYFDKCIEFSKLAEHSNIPILIDASYGGKNIYNIKNLELVVEIAKKVRNVPIVILHSGGIKILEAFLIAEQFENIFLDTSFSVNYYQNFRLLEDYKDVYKKLGSKRIIYGSDFPYCDIRSSYLTNYRI